MSNIWEEFDKNIDVEGLIEDAKEAEENGVSFKEVTPGKYEVKITKMELKKSKKNTPMVSIWFEILDGEFKGNLIFYNQVISTGFGLHNCNEFLKSLDTGVDVTFESFSKYADLLNDIFEAADGNIEYVLNYGVNSKGFNTYAIEEVFEA